MNDEQPIQLKELNRRNTETVEAALRSVENRFDIQQKKIDHLQATVSMLVDKINALELAAMMARAAAAGRGPTVK